MHKSVNPGAAVTDLRQFTHWWWQNGQPYESPRDCVRVCAGSHEFVLYRWEQFQVEQITIMAGFTVQEHCHPNLRTYECHITGGGVAELKVGDHWDRKPYEPSIRHHVKHRRMLIEAGQYHRGFADVVNVALSFQHWLNGVSPTFITDDWVQADGGAWT